MPSLLEGKTKNGAEAGVREAEGEERRVRAVYPSFDVECVCCDRHFRLMSTYTTKIAVVVYVPQLIVFHLPQLVL
jgi:hypothetical protein